MTTASVPQRSPDEIRGATRAIVFLGLVSLFADMTYEGAHSVTGPYLKELGADAFVVSVIAGLGEMLAASLRYFSGRLADRTRAYWWFAIAGYAVNLIVVPAIALVGSWQAVALLLLMERTGKALRGPARDVLLSESTEVVGHGWGFGLHAAMDQTGAVIGPLVVMAIVYWTHGYATAFLFLGIPAALALISILTARSMRASRPPPPAQKPAKVIPKVFWTYAFAAGLLGCGVFDFQLLAFHFEKTEIFSKEIIPLLYAVAMGVEGLTAFFFGRLYDRFGLVILPLGILISLLALPLGFLGGQVGGVAAVVCWATGLGVQDAILKAGIAQAVSMHKRGSAFGSFNAIFGVMWFIGSAAMGLLYTWSPAGLVAFGVVAQFAAAVVFFRIRRTLAAQ